MIIGNKSVVWITELCDIRPTALGCGQWLPNFRWIMLSKIPMINPDMIPSGILSKATPVATPMANPIPSLLMPSLAVFFSSWSSSI